MAEDLEVRNQAARERRGWFERRPDEPAGEHQARWEAYQKGKALELQEKEAVKHLVRMRDEDERAALADHEVNRQVYIMAPPEAL